MYWKDKAALIQREKVPTAEGYKTLRETRRTVFCNRKSVARAEFYAARQAGEQLALVLEVRGADYQNETRVELGGKPYEVVRAYTKSGEIYELNCKEAPAPDPDEQEETP